MEFEVLELIHLLEIGPGLSCSGHRNKFFGSITGRGGGFIEQLIQ